MRRAASFRRRLPHSSACLSPVSYAGVARRTTRRVVAIEATVATTAAATAAAQPKPPPPPPRRRRDRCRSVRSCRRCRPAARATPIGGVQYYNCAPGVYYRAAFQGNNLVYVAAQP